MKSLKEYLPTSLHGKEYLLVGERQVLAALQRFC